jgi:hypothetical protein
MRYKRGRDIKTQVIGVNNFRPYFQRKSQKRQVSGFIVQVIAKSISLGKFLSLHQFFSNNLSRKAEGPCPMMPWQPYNSRQLVSRQ